MTDDRPASDERAERVAHLTGLIQRYMNEWRDGDLDHGPWLKTQTAANYGS
jgi:hypothetical protein